MQMHPLPLLCSPYENNPLSLSLSPFSLFFSPSPRSRWTPGLVVYLLVFQKFSQEYFDNDRRYHINRTDSNGTSVCTCLFRLSIRDLESLLLLCIIETSIIIPFYPRFITKLIIIFRSNESRIRLAASFPPSTILGRIREECRASFKLPSSPLGFLISCNATINLEKNSSEEDRVMII